MTGGRPKIDHFASRLSSSNHDRRRRSDSGSESAAAAPRRPSPHRNSDDPILRRDGSGRVNLNLNVTVTGGDLGRRPTRSLGLGGPMISHGACQLHGPLSARVTSHRDSAGARWLVTSTWQRLGRRASQAHHVSGTLGHCYIALFLAIYQLGYIAPAKLLYSKGAISLFCYIALNMLYSHSVTEGGISQHAI